MSTKQGAKAWMDFIYDLEKKAYVLDFINHPYTHKDAVRDAAILGKTDTKLKEKALVNDPDLDTLVKWGQAHESGSEDIFILDGKQGAISRI